MFWQQWLYFIFRVGVRWLTPYTHMLLKYRLKADRVAEMAAEKPSHILFKTKNHVHVYADSAVAVYSYNAGGMVSCIDISNKSTGELTIISTMRCAILAYASNTLYAIDSKNKQIIEQIRLDGAVLYGEMLPTNVIFIETAGNGGFTSLYYFFVVGDTQLIQFKMETTLDTAERITKVEYIITADGTKHIYLLSLCNNSQIVLAPPFRVVGSTLAEQEEDCIVRKTFNKAKRAWVFELYLGTILDTAFYLIVLDDVITVGNKSLEECTVLRRMKRPIIQCCYNGGTNKLVVATDDNTLTFLEITRHGTSHKLKRIATRQLACAPTLMCLSNDLDRLALVDATHQLHLFEYELISYERRVFLILLTILLVALSASVARLRITNIGG